MFYNWGIKNEGFASPFNARLLGKENAQFYSLFKDTDEIFGSGGSFFKLDQPENPGHRCLDPPFTTEILSKVDKILKDWLATYKDLSFLLIIPESHKPYNEPDETVTLQKDLHYCEGLEGVLKPLPVNVCIHRYGNLESFSAEAVLVGYSKSKHSPRKNLGLCFDHSNSITNSSCLLVLPIYRILLLWYTPN